ncbi:ATP-binding cassette domain-containing protein [Sneathiella chungangensis]|uniref:ATP-binding cassette domain-containing protein n=1 Tax=Sneathiella chungangensis TaxID=1418234 RepID=A0A845MCT5_9PROT|nr:sugar ABC transporter ATP-binding protein [Sneathiella chungangensis]MZR21150.1 ATP-binding cassette domain-containing protein [Sneathiella chungangensis]
MTHPIGLSIRNGTKVYPGTIALNNVDFDVRLGAVNVLVGENGAGKSTMMKVIAGVEQLTDGELLIDGKEVHLRGTADAAAHGIGIVFQELNLFPDLSVSENIFMGRENLQFGVHIDRKRQREVTQRLMERLEHKISPDTLVGDLRIGEQQIVEIAKSLAVDARILILDEPTSALSSSEVEILFKVIADLRARGVGIIYISHRLEELIRIGDYITVLRDGHITGARSMEGVDVPWIVQNMIGSASKDFAKSVEHDFGKEVFRAENISLLREGGKFVVDNVSLSLKEGEIVGIYGLMGAGRSEFFECIMVQHPHSTGRFFVDGEPLTEKTVEGRIRRGIVLIPEDRKAVGLIQMHSVRENMSLSSLRDFTRWFHLDLEKEKKAVMDYVRDLTIKIASPENPVSSLSGGNQQKVVIGKALMTKPKILLMDEPSRGIDVGAKAEVFREMRRLAAEGLGILFVTSDLDEVMSLSDRIIVMSNGRITGEWDRKDTNESMVVAASAVGHARATHIPEKELAE